MSLFSKFTKGNHTEKSIYPWSQRKLGGTSHALPRFGHGATMLDNQHFIIYGDNISATSLSTSGDIPSPRSFTTINSMGGFVLLYGGEPINTGEMWDPYFYVLHTNSRQWSRVRTKGNLPSERASHSTCISSDGVMYIWGGHYQRKYLNDLCAFNVKEYPAKAEWEFIAYENQGPSPRSGHVSIIHDNKLYIFGGVNASHLYNDIWYFDLSTRIWHQIAAVGYIPAPRESCAAAIVDDTIYIFGGRGSNGCDLGDLCAYRIKSKRWFMFQNMGTPPSPRYGSTLTVIQNKIYVFGGECLTGKTDDSSHVYILDCSKIKYKSESEDESSNVDRVDDQPEIFTDKLTTLNDDINPVLKSPRSMTRQLVVSPLMDRNRPLPAIIDQKLNLPAHSMETNNRQITTHDVAPPPPPPRPPREGATLGESYRTLDSSLKFKRESTQPNKPKVTPPTIHHLDAEEKKRLSREITARDVIINEMKKKEQWWRTEVSIARHVRGTSLEEDADHALLMSFSPDQSEDNSEKLLLFKQLVNVKAEIKKIKTNVSKQTESLSQKMELAERIRTVALEEAAYYKAKYVALKTRNYDDLDFLESERVQVLEHRLTQVYEEKTTKEKSILQSQSQSTHDKAARLLAEERARDAQMQSEVAQEAHQQALENLSALYEQIIKAEAKGRSDALVIADLSYKVVQNLSIGNNRADMSHAHIEMGRLEAANIKSRNEIAALVQKLEECKDTEMNLRIFLNEREEAYKESVLELEKAYIELELLKNATSHGKSQTSFK
ncbi:hypothetical protein HPULCUR_006260 [Helicostylum pulchrum]|uniref:Uncharacterized protein n=1 Tax=Helicostylum pulchrum TaxID=562976 RepID=A0ABP9Y1E5_9FUNG